MIIKARHYYFKFEHRKSKQRKSARNRSATPRRSDRAVAAPCTHRITTPFRRDRAARHDMLFNEKLDLKLIRQVRSNPILYDHNHAKYMDFNAREVAWQKIGDELKRPGKSLLYFTIDGWSNLLLVRVSINKS